MMQTLPKPFYVPSHDQTLAVYRWPADNNAAKETLVLIHGYPDSAVVWEPLAKLLATQFNVVAYDVRGAGASTKPRRRRAFRLELLRDDLAAVIDAVSPERPVHLVAYDWGAPQGWEAVFTQALQQRIASFSTAAPAMDHAGVWFHRHFASLSPRKWQRAAKRLIGSSYMTFFQLPLLPEAVWKHYLADRWAAQLSRLEGKALKVPATLESDALHGLGLYRANFIRPLLRPKRHHTSVPVQLLVMQRDPFITPELFEGVEQTVTQLERQNIDAGHWWPLSCPERVAPLISEFVEKHNTERRQANDQ